jgi:hypothetical protein
MMIETEDDGGGRPKCRNLWLYTIGVNDAGSEKEFINGALSKVEMIFAWTDVTKTLLHSLE